MVKTGGWILIILGIVVATLNMAVLLPTNPDYQASWGKVIVAICFSFLGAGMKNGYD